MLAGVQDHKCAHFGSRRGYWHTQDCAYRLGMPADEFICQHIGDKAKHEECFQKWKRLMAQQTENPQCKTPTNHAA
jgi:hypothetical protein